jgi:hypothetical protein
MYQMRLKIIRPPWLTLYENQESQYAAIQFSYTTVDNLSRRICMWANSHARVYIKLKEQRQRNSIQLATIFHQHNNTHTQLLRVCWVENSHCSLRTQYAAGAAGNNNTTCAHTQLLVMKSVIAFSSSSSGWWQLPSCARLVYLRTRYYIWPY